MQGNGLGTVLSGDQVGQEIQVQNWNAVIAVLVPAASSWLLPLSTAVASLLVTLLVSQSHSAPY